jgi:hypothetical protein
MLQLQSMSEELLIAHVENGRYVVDATTDLPDGCVVSMKIVSNGYMTPEEKARLSSAISESLDEIETGGGNDMAEFLEELKAEA